MGDTVAGQVALYKQIDYAPLSTKFYRSNLTILTTKKGCFARSKN